MTSIKKDGERDPCEQAKVIESKTKDLRQVK